MADTLNVTMDNVTDNTNQERTFSQSEVDEIVKSRLQKEKAKYSDYEAMQEKAKAFDEMQEANKTEVQRQTDRAEKLQAEINQMKRENEIRAIREKVASDTGIPVNLLKGETEEECLEQATGILSYKNSSLKYPSVKDGGEVTNVSSTESPEAQFGEWLKKNL